VWVIVEDGQHGHRFGTELLQKLLESPEGLTDLRVWPNMTNAVEPAAGHVQGFNLHDS
jgi:hypothetical protein